MGTSLSIEAPTSAQFNNVREICVRNDNTGMIAESFLLEERLNRHGRFFGECDNALAIAVRQTKCVDIANCRETYEGRRDFRFDIHQATIDGETVRYEREFVYSEFGDRITFRLTGSTVGNARGYVESKRERAIPEELCFEDSCYVVPHTKRSFSAAEDYCMEKGGMLATIHSQEENDVAQYALTHVYDGSTDQVPAEAAWIGYFRYSGRSVGSYSVWQDGSSPSFLNWDTSEPSLGRFESAAELKQNGKWNDVPRENNMRFICEIPRDVIRDGAIYN